MNISVVIPTWNRKNMVGRAIESACVQTLSPAEIIVVDDGSDDGTRQLMEEKYAFVTYIRQKNSGVSRARNVGINKAQSPWVAFLDSDDEWLPEKLERQAGALESDPGYKLCHTDEIWIKNGRRINQKEKHRKSGGRIYQRCLPMCRISPSSVIIHQSVFDDVGLFDEHLPACEDYDMWLRICSKYPVKFLDMPLIKKYGGHGDQLSLKHWGMDRFRIYALEKMLKLEQLTEKQQKQTAEELLKKLNIYIAGAQKRDKKDEVKVLKEKKEKYETYIG